MIRSIQSTASDAHLVGTQSAPAESGVQSLLDGWEDTDVSNADVLAFFIGEDIKYCRATKEWFLWSGSIWHACDIDAVVSRAGELHRVVELAIQPGVRELFKKRLRKLKMAGSIKSMVTMARGRDAIERAGSDFDNQPNNLVVANGTLDLSSRTLVSDFDRAHLATRQSSVFFYPDALCPAWVEFIDEIMDSDPVAVDFIQRLCGYFLSGSNPSQLFFLLYGTGANGKSVFLSVVRALLGDYANACAPDSLMARSAGSPRDDLYRLRNARVVTATELNEDKSFDEALLKQLTGGDMMATRALWGRHSEDVFGAKILIGTNHLPRLSGNDNALFRRFAPIHFPVTIPECDQDPSLPRRLIAELPGILNWSLDGAERLGEDGKLLLSPDIKAERENLRDRMDSVRGFLRARCEFASEYRASRGELRNAYEAYCKNLEILPIHNTQFNDRLRARADISEGTGGERLWSGLALRD